MLRETHGVFVLAQSQIDEFNAFGFLILRDYFTNSEAALIRAEYELRCGVAEGFEPFDGTKRHDMKMMGHDTPFVRSLFDERRWFLGIAEQLAGRALGCSIDVNRFIGNTYWHYDSSSFDSPALKFGCYLDPLRAETGALRVIPGSHQKPFHDEIGRLKACDYAWIRQDNHKEAAVMVGDIPGFVCESDPRDVIVFDQRIFHATFGGLNDRPMLAANYRFYPRTPRETVGLIWESKHIFDERDNSDRPWDPNFVFPPEWLDDPTAPPVRKEWVAEYNKFAAMNEKETGFYAVVRDGKMWVEAVGPQS